MQVYRITYPDGSTAHRPATITQPLPAGLPRGSRVELVEITRARVTVLAELPVIGGRAFAREMDEAEYARMEAAYPWPREIPAGETREEWLRREIAWWLEDAPLGRALLQVWHWWQKWRNWRGRRGKMLRRVELSKQHKENESWTSSKRGTGTS